MNDALGRYWLAVWRDMAAFCEGLPDITTNADLRKLKNSASRERVA
jgi:hypothetical protein